MAITTMTTDDLTYEEWLETWAPSPHLQHSCLPSNLFDPYAMDRLQQDVEAMGDVPRVAKVQGTYNAMTEDESQTRRLDYLQQHQKDWSQDFWERMLEKAVRADRLAAFVKGMAEDWVQGYAVRQKSRAMLALKASIRAHDRLVHRETAGQFVIDDRDSGFAPLFDVNETASLFQVNMDMLS
jgi:hypothetical protein